MISKGTIGGEFHPGLLMPMSRGRYSNKTIIQSVVLNGFVIDIHITDKNKVSNEILNFALNEAGSFIMPIRDIEDIGINLDDFKKHASGNEVSDFFKKHS